MKQREAYRDVPICKTESTCCLTHLVNLRPRKSPHVVLLKLVPEHHFHINRDYTEQKFEEA
ncbi:hypothetical protein IMY05_002G0112700 [Salix suchowensis]|nr:hypothetical protein IMY05_002G0112700 [Salix suchowensis]